MNDTHRRNVLARVSMLLGTLGGIATLIALAIDHRVAALCLFALTALVVAALLVYRRIGHRRLVHVSETGEDRFLSAINWDRIVRLDAMGHTGKIIYTQMEEHLKGLKLTKQPAIRVLTRAPIAETPSREKLISATGSQVEQRRSQGWNIQVHYYHTLPWLRGYVAHYRDGSRRAFIGFYMWGSAWRSLKGAYHVEAADSIQKPNPFTAVFLSWFDHFWGDGDLHTIVFDFDDTLFRTMSLQVEAWATAIERSLEGGILSPADVEPSRVAPALQDRAKLRRILREVFVERQMAEDILGYLLPNVDHERKERINQERFNIRARLMKDVQAFPGLAHLLNKIKDKFHFAIVSATSEKLIEAALANEGIPDCFSVILGKLSPAPEIENVSSKAVLLLKLCNLTGIPCERMVFVGDNNADYTAARQLGIPFIEARMAAVDAEVTTLVRYRSGDRQLSFNAYTNGSFENALMELFPGLALE